MNTKKIGKIVKKNVELAQKSATQLREISKAEYEKARKQLMKNPQVKGFEQQAEKELAKIKKQLDATTKKAENYIKKNPAKAAAISAGIGAALAGIVALMATSKKKK